MRVPVIRIPTSRGVIEADADADPAAVMRLIEMLNREAPKEKAPDPERAEEPSTKNGTNGNASDAKWREFVESLTEGGRRLLAHIKTHPGVTLMELTDAIGEGNASAISGFMRGVFKHATRIGIKKQLIYRREEEGTSRDHTLRYFPGKLLAEKGVDIGARKESKETKG
jgi:hypothetical protein